MHKNILFFGNDLSVMSEMASRMAGGCSFTFCTRMNEAHEAITTAKPDLVIVELALDIPDPVAPIRNLANTDNALSVMVVGDIEHQPKIKKEIDLLFPSCRYARYEAESIEKLINEEG